MITNIIFNKKIILFAIFGFIQVGIDFLIYNFLLYTTGQLSLSKTISNIICILISYALNKRFTFNNNNKDPSIFYKSMFVYGFSLLINVVSNSLAYSYLSSFLQQEYAIVTAFIIATGASASLNFIGLNFVMKK